MDREDLNSVFTGSVSFGRSFIMWHLIDHTEFWTMKVDKHIMCLCSPTLSSEERLSPLWMDIFTGFFIFLTFFIVLILKTALLNFLMHYYLMLMREALCVYIYMCLYTHAMYNTRKQVCLYVSTYAKFSVAYLRMIHKDIKGPQQNWKMQYTVY